ncbi:MAG: NAD(P)/FAD-dependent oxidoreductase [Thermoflexales bacterium]|nr:NAD(P)/FAD-dependent oxidoreductase [Thermoflexales bacterium]
MRYVIAGNSAAAVGAIEAVRQHDADNPITVVSDEAHHVYSRPLISYLLGGLVDEAHMPYRPPDFYERHKVETRLGVEVTRINPQEQTISLAGGEALAYDRLLIATGGRPFVPPIPGLEQKGVFTFTRWEDARRLARYIEDHDVRSALILGGGLIGLKTTEALMKRSIAVTVVELAERILSATFDRTASQLAEGILRRAGVEIRTGATVQEIVGQDGRVNHAILSDGERVNCGVVVLAIGVRPNTSLVPPESGIQVGRGIVVNPCMRTNVPNVYAAGDCVEAYDMLLGASRPIAIWPNAYRQGCVAGCNMAGVYQEYEGGFPMNSVEICSVPTISVGLTDPQAGDGAYEVMDTCDRQAPVYKKLVLRGKQLVGAIFVGDINRAGIYTGLIRDGLDVSSFKDLLLAGNFGLISLPKDYRKHLVVGDGIEV